MEGERHVLEEDQTRLEKAISAAFAQKLEEIEARRKSKSDVLLAHRAQREEDQRAASQQRERAEVEHGVNIAKLRFRLKAVQETAHTSPSSSAVWDALEKEAEEKRDALRKKHSEDAEKVCQLLRHTHTHSTQTHNIFTHVLS